MVLEGGVRGSMLEGRVLEGDAVRREDV